MQTGWDGTNCMACYQRCQSQYCVLNAAHQLVRRCLLNAVELQSEYDKAPVRGADEASSNTGDAATEWIENHAQGMSFSELGFQPMKRAKGSPAGNS
jgi:hypothetical protein